MPLQKIVLKSAELEFVRSRVTGDLHVRDLRTPVSLYRDGGSETLCGRPMPALDGEALESREGARLGCEKCFSALRSYPEEEVTLVRE